MKIRILIMAALIQGCAEHSCDDEISNTVATYGNPEEVNRYDSSGYHSVSYWYWSQGFNYDFTWGNDFDCEVSLYQFSPIRKPSKYTTSEVIDGELVVTEY